MCITFNIYQAAASHSPWPIYNPALDESAAIYIVESISAVTSRDQFSAGVRAPVPPFRLTGKFTSH